MSLKDETQDADNPKTPRPFLGHPGHPGMSYLACPPERVSRWQEEGYRISAACRDVIEVEGQPAFLMEKGDPMETKSPGDIRCPFKVDTALLEKATAPSGVGKPAKPQQPTAS